MTRAASRCRGQIRVRDQRCLAPPALRLLGIQFREAHARPEVGGRRSRRRAIVWHGPHQSPESTSTGKLVRLRKESKLASSSADGFPSRSGAAALAALGITPSRPPAPGSLPHFGNR